MIRPTHAFLPAALLLAAASSPALPLSPAPGYSVAVSEKTYADPAWRKVADALAAKRAGVVVTFSDGSPESARAKLAALAPDFIAFVAKPTECGRAYAASAARLARSLDADPYDDAAWGIVTGVDADSALRQISRRSAVSVRSALGTTGLTEDRFERLLVFSDATAATRISKSANGPVKRETGAPDTDPSEWAAWFSKEKPDLIVTSSHGFENGVEMPFGRGMIVSKGDSLHVVADLAAVKRDYAKRAEAGGGAKLPVIAHDATPRAWLAAGNCLVAHCTTPDALAPVVMSRYGVSQFAGYTVASWHGAAGWGALGLFLDGRYAYSMGDAIWFNRQKLVGEIAALSPAALSHAPAYDESSACGTNILPFMVQSRRAGIIPAGTSRENERKLIGHLWDRDTFVLFGDPAVPVAFPASAKPHAPKIAFEPSAPGAWKFTCRWPSGAKLDGLPALGFRFPKKFAAAPAAPGAPAGTLIADDFLLIPAPKPDASGSLAFELTEAR